MNNFIDAMALKFMIFPCIISFFSIILNLIRLFVSKKHGVENKTFKKITETLMGISMMMIFFTCAALYIDSYTVLLVGIHSFIFWIKFDWFIGSLFICSVIYVVYPVWNPKNNSDIKNKKSKS